MSGRANLISDLCELQTTKHGGRLGSNGRLGPHAHFGSNGHGGSSWLPCESLLLAASIV